MYYLKRKVSPKVQKYRPFCSHPSPRDFHAIPKAIGGWPLRHVTIGSASNICSTHPRLYS